MVQKNANTRLTSGEALSQIVDRTHRSRRCAHLQDVSRLTKTWISHPVRVRRCDATSSGIRARQIVAQIHLQYGATHGYTPTIQTGDFFRRWVAQDREIARRMAAMDRELGGAA